MKKFDVKTFTMSLILPFLLPDYPLAWFAAIAGCTWCIYECIETSLKTYMNKIKEKRTV